MSLRDYVLGTAVFTVVGADAENCLNRMSQQGISLQDIYKIDPLTYSFTCSGRKEGEIRSLAERSYCQCTCEGKFGMKEDILKLIHRPVLLVSLAITVILTFLMGTVVWKIHIDAGDPQGDWKIRHVLRDLGVDIWTPVKDIDPLALRYELLREVPELSWVVVNRKGGKLTVYGLMQEDPSVETEAPCDLIAVREGVITQSTVLEGMALAKVGDSVFEGQILVSGVEDYGLYTKVVHAEGEIYGQTWYRGTLVTPSKRAVKRYTGRIFHELHIIFGRKSINLSGSSSNLGGSYDKIVSTKQLSLSECPFPLYLQRVTYREYTTDFEALPAETARELLCRSWESCLLSSMVAGEIQKTDSVCFEKGGLYIFQGESVCEELLSRPVFSNPQEKGADLLGTNH